MLIGILAQIRLQTLRQIAPKNLEQVLKQGFPGPDDKGQAAQNQDLLFSGGEAKMGDKALFLIDHHINRNPDQDFRRDIEQLVNDGAGGCGDNMAAVAPGIAQQSTERLKTVGTGHGISGK